MRWNKTLWLWALIIAVRLGYALFAVQLDPFLRRDPLHGDAVVHDRIAWTLVSEGHYVYEKGLQVAPGYIWLMAGVYAVAGHQPQAVRFVNALLGLLTLLGLWAMCRRLFGERVANWTLTLAAFHPHLLLISGWLYTENLMLPLLVWSLTLMVQMQEDSSVKRWAVVGILLGLLALTRASFLPFIGLMALWAWRFGHPGWRGAATLLIAACLTVAPYIAYLHARFGHFIPIGLGGYVFLWANNPEADGGFQPGLPKTIVIGGKPVDVQQAIASRDPVERDRRALRLALQWIRENPGALARLLWRKTRLSLSAFGLQDPRHRQRVWALGADVVYWLFLLVAVYGWVRLARLRPALLWLMGLLAAWVWLIIWLYAGGVRPMLALQPYLALGFMLALLKPSRA